MSMASDQRSDAMYQNLDQATTDRLAQLVQSLDFFTTQPDIMHAKEVMLDLLALEPGQTVLEAGCGLGDDAQELSAQVAPGGNVIAVDISEAIIDLARDRATERSEFVTYEVGDLLSLRFDDGTFDAVRCGATLEWVEDAERAFAELLRVLKPGGRLVVGAADHGARILGAGDPVALDVLFQQQLAQAPNPTLARSLPKWFRDSGLREIAVRGVLVMIDSASLEWHPQRQGQLDGLLKDGLITAAVHQEMLAESARAFATHTAYQIGVVIIVAGVKP